MPEEREIPDTPGAIAADAKRRLSENQLGDALMLYLDAARVYAGARDRAQARRCAEEVLALWPTFEASKRLEMTPAKGPAKGPAPRVQLRRLPGSAAVREEGPGDAAPTARTLLPSMFIEMHAEALRLAGRTQEAAARFAEAQAAVEAEVARRHAAQEWAEAFSAALSMVRLAVARGEEGNVAAARRSFVEVAREAAREAITPEYFARGKDALPAAAVEAAAEQARLLADAKLIVEIDAERALVARRTAEVLRELADEHTAAEAILSWEDSWPTLSKDARLRRALLEAPARAADLSGPLSALDKLAATHPSRLELREFAERHAALVAHARARTSPTSST